jgi:hypothetical protein
MLLADNVATGETRLDAANTEAALIARETTE